MSVRGLMVVAMMMVVPACGGAEQPAADVPADKVAVAAPAADATAATVEVGKPAPDFTLTGVDGTAVTLSALRGKPVVLEWFNPGCPFVVYAHEPGGPLATRAAEATAAGVTWLAINSGAPGKQGHGVEVNGEAAKKWSMAHPILVDEDGAVGKQYAAKTTPQMIVIDAQGIVQYAGALDNAPLGKAEGARVEYVDQALSAVQAGQPVATPQTKPYGCSVKYAS